MIFFIVWPKVMRVMSGKNFVVSHLLREMNAIHFTPGTPAPEKAEIPATNSSSGSPTESNGVAAAASNGHNEGESGAIPIIMAPGDPLPTEVETEMYKVEEVIGSLKDRRYVQY